MMVVMTGCCSLVLPIFLPNYHKGGVAGNCRVIDADTEEPLKRATIRLLREGEEVGKERTDSTGSARYIFFYDPILTRRLNEETKLLEPTHSVKYEISKKGYKTIIISHHRYEPNSSDGRTLIEGLPEVVKLEADERD